MPAPDKPAGLSEGAVKIPKSKGIPSIRAQAKRDRQNALASSSKDDRATAGGGAGSGGLDAAGMEKSVVKAVLASPMTVTWPPIPTHLQTTIMAALPKLVPAEVADWHVGRARCHTAAKKEKRRAAKEQKKQGDEKDDLTGKEQGQPAPVKRPETNAAQRPSTTLQGKERTKPDPLLARSEPTPPSILDHLVVGLNETIKTLERQITQIRIELGLMAEALVLKQQPAAVHPGSVHAQAHAASAEQPGMDIGRKGHPRGAESHLLPTAPEHAVDEIMTENDEDDEVPDSAEEADHDLEELTPALAASTAARDLRPTFRPPVEMQYILIPHLSLNPISLGVPVLRYAATYNALVYQYNHLLRIIRTRLGGPDLSNLYSRLASGLGVGKGVELGTREEVSVIPLGKKETELSLLVGLRRVASLAIARTHPSITVLRELVPKSVLKPPRFGLTVAMPVETVLATYGVAAVPSQSRLSAHTSNHPEGKAPPLDEPGPASSASAPALPASTPHYAPLHIKGISTTIPADGMARKRKRLEEVRAKRVEKKVKRKAERELELREMEKGLMKQGPENMRQRRKARKEERKV